MVDTCVDVTKCGKTNDQASTICDFHFANVLYAFLKNLMYIMYYALLTAIKRTLVLCIG